jgi:hypothetical protein
VSDNSIRPGASASSSNTGHGTRIERSVTLSLEGFAWEAVDEEITRAGLTTEELIAFCVLYYLGDRDSGRISRKIARSPYQRSE